MVGLEARGLSVCVCVAHGQFFPTHLKTTGTIMLREKDQSWGRFSTGFIQRLKLRFRFQGVTEIWKVAVLTIARVELVIAQHAR
jgi:hypothetical protein